MKNIYAIVLCLSSTLSFYSWDPGSWKPEASHTPSQTPLLASNIWYLQNANNYKPITSNNHYVCVLFYENNEMNQVINQVAQQFLDVIFLKVNVDKFPTFKRALKSIPAIGLYKSGSIAYFKYGSQTAQELTDVLKKIFKMDV